MKKKNFFKIIIIGILSTLILSNISTVAYHGTTRYIGEVNKNKIEISNDLILNDRSNRDTYNTYYSNHISNEENKPYMNMIENFVTNFEEKTLGYNGNDGLTNTSISEANCKYIIITSDEWADDFQSLADWKTKKGVKTIITPLSWIETYYGPVDEWVIQDFIIDAYYDWGARYILLGGDTEIIPCFNISSYSVKCDTPYGDFDFDYFCEINVGRAPVSYEYEVDVFVNKILNYEKNPPLTDYIKKIALLGFKLDWYTSGSIVKEDIDDKYIPSTWDVTKIYSSQTTKQEVIDVINEGQHLINHIHHGEDDKIYIGPVDLSNYIDNQDVDNLVNWDKPCIFYSMSCSSCSFWYDDSIAEHFVSRPSWNLDGGAIGYIGNSVPVLYSSSNTDILGFKYDRCFFKSLFEENIYHLGECFSDHKNDGVEIGDSAYETIFYALNLIGDPELPIWTDNPKELYVSHKDIVVAGGVTSLNVGVSDIDGPVENATVCLYNEDDVYRVGKTDQDGNTKLKFYADNPGNMYITVTKHNYVPYEEIIDVTYGLGAKKYTLSAGICDNIDLYLNAGPENKNRKYIILGSASGTEPGFALPGGQKTLPLNWDYFTDLVLQLINSPVFSGFLGQLDEDGKAYAEINTEPLGPEWIGQKLYFAYACNNPWDYASNPIEIVIID